MNNLVTTLFDFPTLLETKKDIHNEDLDRLKEKLQHYKRLGMEEAVSSTLIRIKEGTVATFLQGLKFKLLMMPHSEGTTRIFHIETSGVHKGIIIDQFGHQRWCSRILLHDYTDPIPLEILKKLPDEAGLKTYVFTALEVKDPILAFPMTWSETELQISGGLWRFQKKIEKEVPLYCPYWVGLCEWD